VNQIQCPNCGMSNRAGAKFCQHCRASLQIVTTMKSCPKCRTQNRMNAKFCAKCGHVFGANELSAWARRFATSNLGAPAILATIGGLIACLLCALLFVASNQIPARATAVPTTSARVTPATDVPSPLPSLTKSVVASTVTVVPIATAATGLERAERATVLIMVPVDARPGYYSGGSGTVITKRGHILTNYHIFVDDSGKPENARGEIYIGVPPPTDLKAKAQTRYRAKMVQADIKNDLALIQIVATNDNRALPADLGLTVAPIGDSDTLALGDAIFVLGYPGLGGESLTFTRGVVSGFLKDEGFIKTDAEINQGNSGGGAYNAMYQLIGVPSMTVSARQATGKLGLIRPIKTAKPLIDLAKREAGE